MKNKVLSLVLIFFTFAVLSTVASAGKETQLTNDERLTQRTAISGNNIFWTETTANDVHAYDLSTGKRIDIQGNYVTGKINAYGNEIVWTGDDDVYLYDISTDNETKIASERSAPDIYGNYIVYTNDYSYDEDHQNDGIYLYNLKDKKEIKIANAYSSPAIYGRKVVWAQPNSKNGYDICKYDICTQKICTLLTTSNPISDLDIYKNIVIWIESGNIYMYDIAAHKITQVTKSGIASESSIYGNRIVYTNGDPALTGNTDIYMYTISTARTTRITNTTRAFGSSIYGDKIAYTDWRYSPPETSEIRDIFLYELNTRLKNKSNILC